MNNFFLIATGFLLLAAGGEVTVRGAVSSAKQFGLSPFFIGAVVIGFGSSLPELVTSIEAMFTDAPGIAIGNIVGSNIANILLVLGIAALISPLCLRGDDIRRDVLLVLLATAGFVVVSLWTGLSAIVGAAMWMALALYLVLSYQRGNEHSVPQRDVEGRISILSSLGMVIIGLVILVAGGYFVVTGGVGLARSYDVDDTLIGLTIVAIGTTLPEIVTTLVAAVRKEGDVALGNVLGSCMFNILAIGGTIAVVTPTRVPEGIVHFDNLVMLGATAFLCLLVFSLRRIPRIIGATLLAAYIGYLAVLWP